MKSKVMLSIIVVIFVFTSSIPARAADDDGPHLFLPLISTTGLAFGAPLIV